MLHVILYEPEIPPNTGNIIRLCANTGSALHLVEPLGFELDDARLRRAGLDYHEWATVRQYPSLDQCLKETRLRRVFAISTRGQRCYAEVAFQPGDGLLFGPETRGLPQHVLDAQAPNQTLRIPMIEGSRSLNLSNAVAVVVMEARRQLGFQGLV